MDASESNRHVPENQNSPGGPQDDCGDKCGAMMPGISNESRFRALAELRDYHRRVMFGGGAIVTAVILIALLVNVTMLVRLQINHERERFINDINQLTGIINVQEAFFRQMLSRAESALNEKAEAAPELVQSFVDGGCASVVGRASLGGVFLAVGRSGCVTSDDRLRRLLALTPVLEQAPAIGGLERKSPPLTAIVQGGRPLAAYFYHEGLDFAAMMVPPERSAVLLEQAHRNRSSLLQSLVIELPSSGVPIADARSSVKPKRLRWVRPRDDPLAGEVAVRLAGLVQDSGGPVALMVAEYDPDALLSGLNIDAAGSRAYLVSDSEGDLVAARMSPGDAPPSLSFRDSSRRKRAGDSEVETHLAGSFGSFSENISDTGLTLTYRFSWKIVAAPIARQLLILTCMTLGILLVLWATLLLLTTRYFKPILRQASQVFESEQLSRTLIETMPIGLTLIAKDNGTPLLSSPSMRTIGKVAIPALLAKIRKGKFSRFEAGSDDAGRGAMRVELGDAAADGENVYSVTVSPARYLGEDALVAAFSDITDQKKTEAYLRDAKLAADSANAAKSAFVAMVSHEIRTPMSAIIGNLELLDDTTFDASQRARLAMLRTSSAGLVNIINDVLDVSRIESGQMSLEGVTFKVVPVIEEALILFAPVAARKGILLVSEIAMDIAQEISGDPVRLGQIIRNLLSNAIKFTKEGKITALARIDDDQDVLEIEIRDTGIGMTDEQTNRIFQPFVQADASIANRFGGTGLGLYLSQWFARAMFGNLSVVSSLGSGSCFTLTLPLGDHHRIDTDGSQLLGSVLFLSRSDQWRAWAVPHLRSWGLSVRSVKQLRSLSSDDIGQYDVVVMCHDEADWDQDDEDQVFESARWVVDCQLDAPVEPVQMGKLVTISTSSITALNSAMRMVLTGAVLPGVRNASAETFIDDAGVQLENPVRVLAADDNPVNSKLLADQLEKIGAEALVVNSGAAVLAELHSKQWDILLTDLNMPDMRGDEVCSAVRSVLPNVRSFVITAHTTSEERERCMRAGAQGVLLKPVSIQALRDLLQGTNASVRPPTNRSHDGASSIPPHLRESFLAASSNSIEVLRCALDSSDERRMREEIHSLKGMLYSLGFPLLARKCEMMEHKSFRSVAELRALVDGLAAELVALADARDSSGI
jgi:two-component system capsular synthesis sensor histidine kinase RcsC